MQGVDKSLVASLENAVAQRTCKLIKCFDFSKWQAKSHPIFHDFIILLNHRWEALLEAG